MDFNQSLYRQRRWSNNVGLALSMGSMALGLTVLLWILFVLFSNGFAALDWNMFTQSTPAPGTEGGGLANAIVGSLLMVGFSVLVSTPIGVFAGVYLAEYGDTSKTAELTRFVTDIMLSAPSIVLGLFVYAVAVASVGHFSGYAGSMALSLIAIPTTFDLLFDANLNSSDIVVDYIFRGEIFPFSASPPTALTVLSSAQYIVLPRLRTYQSLAIMPWVAGVVPV